MDEKYIFSGIKCGACNGSGYRPAKGSPDSTSKDYSYSDMSTRAIEPPTAEEQFAEHSKKLIAVLQFSSFLPTYLTQQWIGKIKSINLYQPSKGLVILDELFADYWRAVDKYKPKLNIFDLAVVKTIEFDGEIHDIKYELDWLESILKHVADYFKKNPFKRK
jgi:hypothetical protein